MEIKIALAGNPNCGKTTLFNDLTGSAQYVGNWPGVTVEKKDGRMKSNKDVVLQDLPGIYSLSPYTLEEVVTRKYLVNEKPDVIINIIDGTNIERNLYLTTQILELTQFYSEYQSVENLAPLVREISWSKHISILKKCKNPKEREFYILATKKFGWTKNLLIHQIENKPRLKILKRGQNICF